jgi:hypothetical protein
MCIGTIINVIFNDLNGRYFVLVVFVGNETDLGPNKTTDFGFKDSKLNNIVGFAFASKSRPQSSV